MQNARFAEEYILKNIVDPVDWNTAAVTGGRIDMKDLEKVIFIAVLNSATSRTAIDIDFDQHTVATSGTPIALSIDNAYYHKVGAATSFTKVEPSSKADAYNLLTLVGDSKAILVFEVRSSDLTDGYRWVSANTSDTGAAGIGCVLALGQARFKPAAALVV